MKKYYCFIIILLCGITTSLSAQTLSGIVVDNDDSTLAGIIIQNKTHLQTAISDANGHYSITAYKGDVVEFTYLGYYPYSLQKLEDGNASRKVALNKKAYTLDEVVIGPQYTPYQLDSIERRKTYQGALGRGFASSSVLGSVFSPASALAEQFSKEAKQVKRFQRNFVKWEDQKFVDTRYTFDEVSKLTGLTGDTLAAFIAAYPMAPDYARAATDLEVKMWIKYNYREWIKKPIVLPPQQELPKAIEVTDTSKKP